MQFPEPHHKCKHLQQIFCNNRGENVQRRETEASYQWIWWAGKAWEIGLYDKSTRITRKSSL